MVHCSVGKSRTGTILAAYPIKKENGMTADKAISRLSRIRGEPSNELYLAKIVRLSVCLPIRLFYIFIW